MEAFDDTHELTRLVLDKIKLLGDAEAATWFDVSPGTILAWKTGKNLPSLAAAQKAYDESLYHQTPEIQGLEKPAFVLCLPMYENVEPLFLFSLLRCLKLYGIEKVAVIPKIRTLIEEARNDLAEKALLTGSEWIVYADADMVLPCGNGAMLRKQGFNVPEPKASINAIARIMSHPKDVRIVGGLYRDRRGGTKVQCSAGFESPEKNKRLMDLFTTASKDTGLEEVGWVGFGLVRFHRSVFDEMKAEALKPGGLMPEIAPPPPPRDKEPFGFFGRSSQWRGEDIALCRRAGLIGIKTYIDTSLLMGHRGGKIY